MTKETEVYPYFLSISRMVRERLRQPMSWAHVLAVSLDHARKKSPYGSEPAVLELRRELQNRILNRLPIGRAEVGLSDQALVEAATLMDETSGSDRTHSLEDRTLAWLSEFYENVDDWTLQAWRELIATRGISAGHFLGEKPWLPPTKTSASNLESAISWNDALGELVGLQGIKSEVKRLRDFLRVRMLRQKRGYRTGGFALHQVFLGNPGTGKTSVARILAQVYKEFGFLSKGHLVETDRSGLVGQYVGATEFKTESVIRSALGGVLFIDEAYSLAGGGAEDFGPRAIDTLVKMMEDFRNDLIVIVAGYTAQMDSFLQANSGLSSRFTRYLNFPDYSPEELREILLKTVRREMYSIPEDAVSRATELLKQKRAVFGNRFGNAREVRNIWEQMLMLQASRLCETYGEGSIPDEELMVLKPLDVPIIDSQNG